MRHVALLRGINVGGKSIIKMAALKECVEAIGHGDVRTYIASGNVLFESSERSGSKLDAQLERTIEKTFGLPVRVVVRNATEIQRIADGIPAAWLAAAELRVTVGFVLRGNDARAIARGLRPKDGIDEVVAVPGALIWAIRRDALTRAGLKLIGTPVYKQMTLRNLNTTLKLAELVRPTP
ncbi:MAG TPA: DUF1697 domain-containing protein [Gaiellaceae bacterium]